MSDYAVLAIVLLVVLFVLYKRPSIGIGNLVAGIISYSTWHSVFWCVIHTLFGWLYILYFILVYVLHLHLGGYSFPHHPSHFSSLLRLIHSREQICGRG
jgi:hypothetical protein